MNIYLYYGTEENLFEIEKHKVDNVFGYVIDFLVDVCSYEESERIAKQIENEVYSKGYSLYEDVNEQGYNIFIGVAKQGYCNIVRNQLKEKRKTCMEMAGFC